MLEPQNNEKFFTTFYDYPSFPPPFIYRQSYRTSLCIRIYALVYVNTKIYFLFKIWFTFLVGRKKFVPSFSFSSIRVPFNESLIRCRLYKNDLTFSKFNFGSRQVIPPLEFGTCIFFAYHEWSIMISSKLKFKRWPPLG